MPSKMDHVADVAKGGVELRRLAQIYPFPDLVKQADPECNLTPADVSDHLYADIPRRQFPCHTAASTWLSALFYQEKRAEFHPKDRVQIEQRLTHYVKYWRIKAAVDQMMQRWDDLHKDAESQLSDADFAYVWGGDTGGKERRLPMRSAMEVKAAADWLLQYRDRLPYPDRRAIASRVLEKAAKFGAAISDRTEFLEKQAGRGVCDPAEVVTMIEQRARLVNNPDLKQHFTKMAETIRIMPRKALMPDMLVKLAETVDQLDRQMGLVGKYSDGLPRPEDVLFKATFSKVAQDLYAHVSTTSGKVYEKAALTRLTVSDLQSLFGDEFVQRVQTPLGDIDATKMAEEVQALPRPDAELLDSLLNEQGIVPVLRKAASAKQGFTPEEMAAWAAAYASAG